jgi:hypothetical protein
VIQAMTVMTFPDTARFIVEGPCLFEEEHGKVFLQQRSRRLSHTLCSYSPRDFSMIEKMKMFSAHTKPG